MSNFSPLGDDTADIGTGYGQVGHFWQLANFFWHGAKSCRTTWDALQDGSLMLAGCQSDWQYANAIACFSYFSPEEEGFGQVEGTVDMSLCCHERNC